MYECSGEMRYWENHYNQVQAGIKLKEAETTFQNITLGGYLGWNFLLRFSLSGHSVIRPSIRYVKVNWNQRGFFRVDKNPGSQSQDQMIASLPSFHLEDSVGHRLSSPLTYSLLCGKNGNHLSDGGHSQNVPLSILDRTSDSQEPAFIQAVPGNTPQCCVGACHSWRSRVEVLKGQTSGI